MEHIHFTRARFWKHTCYLHKMFCTWLWPGRTPAAVQYVIRYSTIWDATLTCAQKLTWVSLIYRTEPTTEKVENGKIKKTDMIGSISKQSGDSVESVQKKKRKTTVGRICRKGRQTTSHYPAMWTCLWTLAAAFLAPNATLLTWLHSSMLGIRWQKLPIQQWLGNGCYHQWHWHTVDSRHQLQWKSYDAMNGTAKKAVDVSKAAKMQRVLTSCSALTRP